MEKQVLFQSRVDIMRMPNWPTAIPPDHDLGDDQVPSSGELDWSHRSLPEVSSSTRCSRFGLPSSSTHRGAAGNYNYGYSTAQPSNQLGLLLFSEGDDFSQGYSRWAWVHDQQRRWTVACWTCILLLSLMILAVVAIVLTWLIIMPRRPDLNLLNQAIRVQYLTVSKDFSSTSQQNGTTGQVVTARLFANFTLQLLVQNPNRVATDYSSSRLSVAYRDSVVGEATVPAFVQKAHAITQQPLDLLIAKVDIPQQNALSLLEDADVHDSISLQVHGHVHARLQILGRSTPPVLIKLWCSVEIKVSELEVTNQQCHA